MAAFHNILSLNVRGLRDSKKRREIFRWLKRFHNLNDSILFLQEMYTVERDKAIWEKQWGWGETFIYQTSNKIVEVWQLSYQRKLTL